MTICLILIDSIGKEENFFDIERLFQLLLNLLLAQGWIPALREQTFLCCKKGAFSISVNTSAFEDEILHRITVDHRFQKEIFS